MGQLIFIFLPIFVSLVNLLPAFGWWQECLKNFALYLLLGQVVAFVLLLSDIFEIERRATRWLTGILLVLMIGYYGQFYFKFFWYPVPKTTKIDFRAAFLRVEATQQSLQSEIARLHPDLALISADKDSYLPDFKDYNVQSVNGAEHKLRLLSKLPFDASCNHTVDDPFPPGLSTCLILPDGRKLGVLGFDAGLPIGRKAFYNRRITIRRLATYAKHSASDFVILAGMDGDVMAKSYKFFFDEDGVSDAAWGRGLVKTWQQGNPLFWFNLDHIFYRGELSAQAFSTEESPFSDHKILLADFSFE